MNSAAKKVIFCSALAFSCSACSTASFSPPATNLLNEMQVRGGNGTFLKPCRPQEKRVAVSGKEKKQPVAIKRTADGAIVLANNFIFEFRCASHSAGNSRQVFEVPGLLTGIGSATAIALGASSDVAIAGGAATALFDGAKDYYAPVGKAVIYDSALDAQLCIKSAALDIKPFSTSSDKALKLTEKLQKDATQSNVIYFSAERQFFELVSTALLSVERIAASRLRTIAKFEPEGILAQAEKLAKEVEEKENKAKTAATDPKNSEMRGAAEAIVDENKTTAAISNTKRRDEIVDTVTQALTQNELMHAKLQQCVLRAKI